VSRKLPNPNHKAANRLWLLALLASSFIVTVVVLLSLPQGIAPAPCGVQASQVECGGEG